MSNVWRSYDFAPNAELLPRERLFKRDYNGNILVWQGFVSKEVVTEKYTTKNVIRLCFRYGVYDGKLQYHKTDIIVKKSQSTVIGQAKFELDSIYNKQIKKGYKSLYLLTGNAAYNNDFAHSVISTEHNLLNNLLPIYNTDANNCIKPMKCQKFQIGKFRYPALIQPKINGVRAVVMLEEFTPTDLFDTNYITKNNKNYKVVIKTKEGLQYHIEHLELLFMYFYMNVENSFNIVFDGELYIPFEKVTSIGGAARNPQNPLHEKLIFVNFDLSIPEKTNAERDEIRLQIWNEFRSKNKFQVRYSSIYYSDHSEHSTWSNYKIIVLLSDDVYSDEGALDYMEKCIRKGFEGAVIRTKEADYQFGSRPKTMMKLKKFEDAEFECIDYKWSGDPELKVGFSVVLICRNDINDGVFESTVIGTVEERKAIIDNPPIGKKVTIKFYERTKNGLPFHSNVIAIRDYE